MVNFPSSSGYKPDLASERMRENERRLMEESAEAEILEETLNKSISLTSEMVEMLNSFDSRLLNFEKSILPIHKSTQRLTRFYENIDRTLIETTRIIDFFDLAEREQKLIASGPMENDILPYIASLSKIGEALVTLTDARFTSGEKAVYKLRQQHNLGVVQLAQLYKKWLTALSNPIRDPLSIVDSPPSQPAPEILERLGGLSFWLTSMPVPFDPDSHPRRTYSIVRSAYLTRSLQPLSAVALDDIKRCSTIFIQMVNSLTVLLDFEKSTMSAALRVKDGGGSLETWASTISPALTLVVETGEKVLQLIKRRNDFTLVFMLFDVLEFWSVHRERLTLHSSKIPEKTKAMDSLFDSWSIAALRAIPEVYEEVRGSAKGAIPTDATVHESTSNTMSFLKRLLDYPDATESLLLTIGEKDWGNPGLNVTDIKYVKSKGELTEKYFELIFSSLESNLEYKAKQYKKGTHGNLFMLNNLNYLNKALKSHQRSPLAMLERFKKGIKVNKDQLLDSAVQPVATCLMDVTMIQDGAIKTSLSGSERNSVKEKFKTFNLHLEEMLKIMRVCTVPDPDVKASLVNEVRMNLLPMYERFFTKYANSDFSKNKEKYVKFTPSQVKAEIGAMFKS